MSAEAGGTLGGLFILALAGPAVVTALATVIVGAAVVGTVAVAVKAARAINRAARRNHERTTKDSINKLQRDNAANEFAQRIANQRQEMLDMYSQQSEQIATASERQINVGVGISNELNNQGERTHQMLKDLKLRAREVHENVSNETNQRQEQINKEIGVKLKDWSNKVQCMIDDNIKEANNRLNRINNHLDRERQAIEYAVELKSKVQLMHNQLISEEDAETLIGPQLQALNRLLRDCNDLIMNGQGKAAIASVVAFAQNTMEAYVKYDSEYHRRQLIAEQMNICLATLRTVVENGVQIGSEQYKNLPNDGNYWTEGRLEPVVNRARHLLEEYDGLNNMTIAGREKLLKNICNCTQELNSVLERGRYAYACSVLRLDMIKKARSGFQAGGWNAQGWGAVDNDYRKAAVMRFRNPAGSIADLLLSPVYNNATGEYDVDVSIERHDPGVIDEMLRAEQLRQLKANLTNIGVTENNVECKMATEGRNANGPLNQKRFGIPQV